MLATCRSRAGKLFGPRQSKVGLVIVGLVLPARRLTWRHVSGFLILEPLHILENGGGDGTRRPMGTLVNIISSRRRTITKLMLVCVPSKQSRPQAESLHFAPSSRCRARSGGSGQLEWPSQGRAANRKQNGKFERFPGRIADLKCRPEALGPLRVRAQRRAALLQGECRCATRVSLASGPHANLDRSERRLNQQLIWLKLSRANGSGFEGRNASAAERELLNEVKLISLNEKLIAPDKRFKVRRQSALKWTLTIDDVGADDNHAYYLCQTSAPEAKRANQVSARPSKNLLASIFKSSETKHFAHLRAPINPTQTDKSASRFAGGGRLNVLSKFSEGIKSTLRTSCSRLTIQSGTQQCRQKSSNRRRATVWCKWTSLIRWFCVAKFWANPSRS